MFVRRLLPVGVVLLSFTLARLPAAPPPPPKPPMPAHKPAPPPHHHTMNQHHHPPQHHYAYPHYNMPYIPLLTSFYPYMPWYPMPYNATPTGVAQAPTSMSGLDRELVLPLAGDATLSQLKPGTLTAYQPAKFEALKAEQIVTVLVKPEKPTDKPITWTLYAKVIAVEDGDPRQLTLMAKLNPGQGEFDPAKKVIAAVTIKAQPAVAQK